MESKSYRATRFPGQDQSQVADLKVHEKNTNVNRRTRFPGGSEPKEFILSANDKQSVEGKPENEQATRFLPRIPLSINLPINLPDTVSGKPFPKMSMKAQQNQPPPILIERPWNTYTSLHPLERGGRVIAACTRQVPIKMVTVKKLSSENLKELGKCQHDNLLTIIELYRFEGIFFVITDYTVATLKQIIAIPLPLEELHISATCRQASSYYYV